MKRAVVLCTAMMFVFLYLDAEVRSAEELFKRWFLKDALNQHVYTDVTLKKSSQDYDEVYGNLFKKHINKHKELLEPTFRFLNSCTGCNLHEFSQENFTISEFAPLLLHCMEGTKERQLLLNFRISDTQFGGRFPTENQAACADGGEASGCTAKRRPIAFRMAVKLLRAGLPFGDSVR